ncbi:hypothetical protein NP88_7339 [Burkholderia cepacia]|nr:hypothetical protein NP88_7339 [Burkholderia cepacia]
MVFPEIERFGQSHLCRINLPRKQLFPLERVIERALILTLHVGSARFLIQFPLTCWFRTNLYPQRRQPGRSSTTKAPLSVNEHDVACFIDIRARRLALPAGR